MSLIDSHWYKNEKTGWYELTIVRHELTIKEWMDKFSAIKIWIFENIDAPYKHARWNINPEIARFKFRYERNYLQFILRWA